MTDVEFVDYVESQCSPWRMDLDQPKAFRLWGLTGHPILRCAHLNRGDYFSLDMTLGHDILTAARAGIARRLAEKLTK